MDCGWTGGWMDGEWWMTDDDGGVEQAAVYIGW